MKIEHPTAFDASYAEAFRHVAKKIVAIQTRHRERYIKAWLAFTKLPPTMVVLEERVFHHLDGNSLQFSVVPVPLPGGHELILPKLWQQLIHWLEGQTDMTVRLQRASGVWICTFAREGRKLGYADPTIVELFRHILSEPPWLKDWR